MSDKELSQLLAEADFECMINEILREEQETNDVYFEDKEDSYGRY